MSAEAIRWQAPNLGGAAAAAAAPARAPGPSVEELAAIEKAAREEGLAAGRAEGLAQGQAEVRRLTLQLQAVLNAFSRPLEQLDDEIESVLGELAVRIAGELLGRAYCAEPELLAELVRTALAQVGSTARDAEVHLNPADLNLLRQQLEAIEPARLVADPTLKRGELRVHSDLLRLDGTLAARLDSALAALQREPDIAEGDAA